MRHYFWLGADQLFFIWAWRRRGDECVWPRPLAGAAGRGPGPLRASRGVAGRPRAPPPASLCYQMRR